MTDDRLRFRVDRTESGGSKRESAAAPFPPASKAGRSGKRTAVIVKVGPSNYVPPGFDVQNRIDDKLFTARADADAIRAADDDPDVISISPSRPLHSD